MRVLVMLLLVAAAAAASAGERPGVRQGDVDGWLKAWQSRLRLEDWKITARVVRARELKGDTLGHVQWDRASHVASIQVLSPADYDIPEGEIAADMELTVVHELVHLQLSALPRDSNRAREEVVVNRIATALVALERGAAAGSGGLSESAGGDAGRTKKSPARR